MKAIWLLYLAASASLLSAYAVEEMVGWEPQSSAYERIEPSVRTSPGSTGSSGVVHSGGGFWHSGSHGGK